MYLYLSQRAQCSSQWQWEVLAPPCSEMHSILQSDVKYSHFSMVLCSCTNRFYWKQSSTLVPAGDFSDEKTYGKNKLFGQMYIRYLCKYSVLMSSIRLKTLNLWSWIYTAFVTDHPSYLLSSSIWKAEDIAKFLHQSAWAVHSDFSKRCTSKQHERMRNLLYSLSIFLLVTSLHFPSGGLIPTEERGLQKIS